MAVTAQTQTLALANDLLKDLYIGPLVEQLNQKTYLIDMIERESDGIDFRGRKAVVPLRIGRNRGRGSRADNSAMPQAGRQNVDAAEVNMRYHYIGIEITDPTIEATKGGDGAFVSALELETDGAADDLRKDLNRQCFGEGTGQLASISSTGANTTHTLDSVQYVDVGDPVDVKTITTGADVGTNPRTITARVGGATKTVTFDTSVTPTGASLDAVFLAGSRLNEMDGLRNIAGLTTGTLHNIDKSTNAFWRPSVRAAGSAVAGESLYEQLADDVGASGRGEVEIFLTSRGARRRLADTYQSQKRFNDAQATKIHGGYSAIMVNEVPVVADDDCPRGWIFAINHDALKWYELCEPKWMEDSGGSVLALKDSTTPTQGKMNVWQGWLKWYAALGSHAPNRLGAISGAADDDPV